MSKHQFWVTNLLFITLTFGTNSIGLANKGGEQSGSGGKNLRRAFADTEGPAAFLSPNFEKRTRDLTLPGLEFRLDPTSEICIEGDEIQTTWPVEYCEMWQVQTKRNYEHGEYLEFVEYSEAYNFSRSKYGRSRPTCLNRVTSGHYSIPIEGTVRRCTYWKVDNKDGGGARRFKYFRAAMDWSDEGSNAQGLPYCDPRDLKWVDHGFKNHYLVRFFAPGTDKKLGEHRYRFFSCDHLRRFQQDVEVAGGEQSGSGKPKKSRNL